MAQVKFERPGTSNKRPVASNRRGAFDSTRRSGMIQTTSRRNYAASALLNLRC